MYILCANDRRTLLYKTVYDWQRPSVIQTESLNEYKFFSLDTISYTLYTGCFDYSKKAVFFMLFDDIR